MASVLAAAGVAVVPAAPVLADAAGRGGDFVPVTTAQLLDTRSGVGATAGARGPGSTTTVQVLGRAGVPASGVSALLVDVTAVNPTVATYFTLWPDGVARPAVSALNVKAGVVQSNSAVVPVGANGKINYYNHNGSTHIVSEVHGYFLTNPTTATGRGGFVPVPHTRLVDTRSGLGAPKATVAAGGSVTVTVGNGAPIPAGASAAFVNLTVVGATRSSYLTAYPAGGTAAGSTFDYPVGTTAQTMAVKLGTDGGIVVRNTGGAAINLLVDAHGYFTAEPTQGAGYRPAVSRLLDTADTPVPAGGSVDVAVGGTNGLPTRDIAGAVLNLTVANPAGGGHLVAWPTGQPVPTTSLNNFNAGESRSSAVVLRPGAEGKVTVRNQSSSPLRLIVDLQGWFADPLPTVPIAQFSRTVAMQAAPGGAALLGTPEFAYVDNIGRLFHGRMPDPDSLHNVQWTALSDGQAFTGPPALAQQPDGRIQVVAQHTDSNVWSRNQSEPGLSGWAAWSHLGGSMAGPPTVQRLPDGTLVQFAVDVDGRLWHLPQDAANGAYTSWRSLGASGLVGTPAVAVLENALQLFVPDAAGALRTATYYPGGTLSAWTDLGGAGLTGTPAVVVYPGFRMRVVVRSADGTLVSKAQDGSGTFAATWAPVGDLVAAGSPAALLHPGNGRTEVIARRADGTMHAIRETAQGSGEWGSWIQAAQGGFTATTDPTVLSYLNSGGPTYIFVARDADNVFRVWYPPGESALRDETAEPRYGGLRLTSPPA
ncbi:hypothetical protein ACN27G_21435 [Plantactinospora sp. WMMB334]|uniref:hypothetical protein n=1 Tax=Plantactinospora sp. WMMB334 TaxID=3404119 RepID=UPI003B941B55